MARAIFSRILPLPGQHRLQVSADPLKGWATCWMVFKSCCKRASRIFAGSYSCRYDKLARIRMYRSLPLQHLDPEFTSRPGMAESCSKQHQKALGFCDWPEPYVKSRVIHPPIGSRSVVRFSQLSSIRKAAPGRQVWTGGHSCRHSGIFAGLRISIGSHRNDWNSLAPGSWRIAMVAWSRP